MCLYWCLVRPHWTCKHTSCNTLNFVSHVAQHFFPCRPTLNSFCLYWMLVLAYSVFVEFPAEFVLESFDLVLLLFPDATRWFIAGLSVVCTRHIMTCDIAITITAARTTHTLCSNISESASECLPRNWQWILMEFQDIYSQTGYKFISARTHHIKAEPSCNQCIASIPAFDGASNKRVSSIAIVRIKNPVNGWNFTIIL